MIRTEEKLIGGAMYSVTQLPARRALKLKAKLLRIFGAPLAQLLIKEDSQKALFTENKDGKNEINIEKMDIVRALPMLFAEMDDKTYESIVLELLQGVRKDGMELNEHLIDIEFAGELNILMQVLFFVVTVNFGSFFSETATGSELKSPKIAQFR